MEAVQIEPKTEVSLIGPEDFEDVWEVFKVYFSEKPWPYPNIQGLSDEEIKAQLYRYCGSPTAMSFIFRIDGKPCGQIICRVAKQTFGNSKQYLFVFNLYVLPEFRGLGIASQLWKAVTEKMREFGLTHWQAATFDGFEEVLTSTKELNASRLFSVVGGTI